MGHQLWEVVGVLMIGGPAAAGMLLMAWHAARAVRRADEAVAWGGAWHAEAKRMTARAAELGQRAKDAEAREAELKRQLAAAAERRRLDSVIASHNLTDTGWGRAS